MPFALAASLLLSLSTAPPASFAAPPARLELVELYVAKGRGVVLSPRVRALAGRRVRMRGYMVELEEPLRGAFFLAERPVACDESGGGTGDVPPDAIRVRVPGTERRGIPWRPGPVEVVGTLEVGREEDDEGRVSAVRLVLEEPPGPAAGPEDASAGAAPRGQPASHPKERS